MYKQSSSAKPNKSMMRSASTAKKPSHSVTSADRSARSQEMATVKSKAKAAKAQKMTEIKHKNTRAAAKQAKFATKRTKMMGVDRRQANIAAKKK